MNSQAPWLVFKGSRVCLVSCVAAELGCSVLGTVENVQLRERETAVNDQSVSYSNNYAIWVGRRAAAPPRRTATCS